ncbi:uncharacterized protein LOC131250539 [Magnolia sinica]|uniref:uncharacterized protein LOC131250539 n=1 Tax=Magnolia sinica TaxID=86752 RepID=UPI002659F503|nr:uncharacterized protein LOC131250539 [Magnolia sinica]
MEWPRRAPSRKSVSFQPRDGVVLVKWKVSSPGWVKLNVDGSALSNPGPSGGGGVCRNASGSFVFGFSAAYGVGSNNLAELRAIHDGMVFCLEKGLIRVIVESDSEVVIAALSSPSKTPWRWQPWLARIFCLCRLGHFSFSHTLREGNGPADALARVGSLHQQSSLHHDSISLPSRIRGMIFLDKVAIGDFKPR